MKNLLLIVSLFFCLTIVSQTAPVNSSYSVTHGICVNKNLSIVFYVILDTNGTPGIATTPTLTILMSEINKHFEKICVKFLNCSTVYIPNHEYGRWKYNITEPAVVTSWHTEKTINIYLTDTVLAEPPPFSNEVGYAHYPTQPATVTTKPDIIVLEKNRILQNNSAYPLHMLGHFFGLKHTDTEINPQIVATPSISGVTSQEYVDGSNCFIHGDGLCDTEADPGASTATVDAHGDKYLRPLDNLMSVYSTRYRFTTEQLNFMANCIMTSRKYLH